MADNTIVDKINEGTPKPDWFLSQVSGALPSTLDGLSSKGVSPTDFGIRKADEYWNLDNVKKLFQGDKKAFDGIYGQSIAKYNQFAQNEMLTENFITGGRTLLQQRSNFYAPSPKIQRRAPDAWGRTYNTLQTTGGGFNEKQRGWRETAIETGVKNGEGEYISTKEFDGLSRFARNTDGSMAVNEDGRPYMLPVGESEELAGFEEIYNPTAEWMGYYGHDYSMSQIISSIPKNALNFVSNTIDSLAEYPKAIMALQGLDNSDFYKDVVGVENWAKSFRISQTERGQDSFFSLESISDLAQQVVYQLGSMVATGGSIGALTGSAKLGSIAGKMFMVGIAAGDIAEVSRDAGLSNKESALLLGLTSAAFYPLMGLSEAAVGSLNLQNTKAASTAAIKEFMNVLPKNSSGSWKAAFTNARSNAKDALFRGTVAGEGNALVGAGFGAATEAVEEVSEQVIDIGVRNLYNLYNNNIDESSPVSKWLGTNKNDAFHFDWVKEAQLIGFSAFGGAIGGAIANRMFRAMGMKNPSLQRGLWDSVANGDENILRRTIDQLHQEERLAEGWLNESEDIARLGEVSKNDAAHNVLTGLIDWMVETRDSQEVAQVIPNNEARLNALKILFTNLDKPSQDLITNSLPSSSLGKDAANLSRSIVDLDTRITEKQGAASSDSDLIKDLQEERDLKQERLKTIVKGDAVGDYITEGIYSLNAISKAGFDFSARKLNGKQFVSLSKLYSSTLNNLNEQYQEDLNDFNERNKDITIENAPSAVSVEAKEKLVTDAQKNYADQFTALAAIVTPEDNFDIELFAQQAGDPDSSTAQINESFADFIINNDRSKDPRFADILQARVDLLKVRDIGVESEPEAPIATEPLMTMIQRSNGDDGAFITPTRVPIHKKLDDELSLEKKSVSGGISTYTGTDRLAEIKDSIEVRQAQLKAITQIEPLTTPIYERLGQQPLPQITGETATGLLGALDSQLKDVNNLLRIANSNERNQEVAIKQITLQKLEKEADMATEIAFQAAGTNITQIKDIINAYSEPMYSAIEKGDIEGFFSAQRQMESELYDSLADKKSELLELFKPSEDITPSMISSGKVDNEIKRYNYIRRVVSLKANDFWNAYSSAIENSKNDFPPSDEQLIVVKQAVQSLMGNKYAPKWLKVHPRPVSHNNSVLVRGDGGSGKTKQALPLIVATLQNLPGIGKVFVTSKHFDEDMSKVENITNAIKSYFQDGTINFNNSNKDIEAFLDSDEIVDTNLIVYDEATLLTSNQLRNIQAKIDTINELRIEDGKTPIKIIYAADLKQNSIDVESQKNLAKSGEETAARGFDDKAVHLIDKTEVLNYSFRSQNMPLKIMSTYFGEVQNQRGQGTALKMEYRAGKGVNVINDYDSFISHARSVIDGFAKKGRLADVVYITDKDPSELDSKIKSFTQLQVITPMQSQGIEWDSVILDLKDDTPFAETTNKPVKRAYYTGVTRAENYLVMHMNPSAKITSTEGTIRIFEPLSKEDNTLENHLNSVSSILGNASGESFSVKQPIHEPDTKTTETVETVEAPVDTTAREVQELVERLSTEEYMSMFTFFTAAEDGDSGTLNKALWTKRKIMYEPSPTFTYNLVIALNGSPEYTTVINRNPELEGEIAMYIEADAGRGSDIFAVLPTSKDLDKLRAILGNQDSVRITLDPMLMSPMRNTQPNIRVTDTFSTYQKMRKDSAPGLIFGTPRIIMNDYVVEDKLQHRAGDVVVPVTFKDITAEQLDVLNNSTKDKPEGVTFVNMTKGRTSIENFVEELQERYYDSEKGFTWKDKNFNAYYYSFWGHYTKHGFIDQKGDKSTFNYIGSVFQQLAAKAEKGDYKDFLTYYSKTFVKSEGDLKVEKGSKLQAVQEVVASTDVGKVKSKIGRSNVYNFMAHYLYIKNRDIHLAHRAIRGFKQDMYERAIEEVKGYHDSTAKNPSTFGDGLLFTPKLGPDKRRGHGKSWHAQSWKLTEDHDNFLKKKGFVGLPQPQILTQNIVDSIGIAATVNEGSFSSETGGSIKSSINVKGSDFAAEYEQGNVIYKESTFKRDKTLLDFYSLWYNKRPERMISAINKFKKGIYNEIFDFKNGNIHSVDTAVKGYKDKINRSAGIALSAGMTVKNAMRIVDEDGNKADLADALAINSSLDFLLNFYFPTIKFSEGNFNFGVSLLKQEGFYDNESVSYLHEGMNEMITTQLMNTPIIESNNNVFEARVDTKGNPVYITRNDIEDLVQVGKDSTSVEEFIETLKVSPEAVMRSIYIRFFSPSVSSVKIAPGQAGSDVIRSMSQWNHADAQNIVTSLYSFIRSGDIFNLASVNLLDGEFKYKGLPIGAFGRPNIVREELFTALKTRAHTISDKVISHADRIVIDGVSYHKSSKRLPTEAEVLKGLEVVGLGMFGKNALNYLYLHPELLNTRKDNKEEQNQVARNELMDMIIIPMGKEIKNGDTSSFTKYINTFSGIGGLESRIFAPIIESANINYMLRQKNIDGNMVERLRKSIPVMRFNERVNRARNFSLHSDNLLANGTYKIDTMFLKEGFKRFVAGSTVSRSSNAASPAETADLDILYGFQQVLNQTDGEFAALPLQIFSDSPTNVNAIVTTDKGFFRDPKDIYKDLFEARANYYRKLEQEIVKRYNDAFGISVSTLSGINEFLNDKKISQLEKLPGFVKGLMYDQRPEKKGQAQLKPELLKEVVFYKGNNFKGFLGQMDTKYKKLKALADSSIGTADMSLTQRLGKKGEVTLKSFHANWIAVSSQYLDLMVGSRFQYDAKDNTEFPETGEYLDYVKRSQSETSSRTLFVHRNDSWDSRFGTDNTLTAAEINEGKKLPKNIKVAYVHDIKEKVWLATKDSSLDQEIYDGATFVLPLMRSMQSASLGENFGIGTPPVMKNVTTAWDEELGIKTYIKHAEFLITPEIMQNGTVRVQSMVKNMLNQPLNRTYDMDGTQVKTAWETLMALGVNENLDNVTQEHFDELFDILVKWGDQDTPIMELIPSSSVKTGQGAINSIDSQNWATENLDITNKGIQLDASKEAGKEHTIRVLTQMVNTAVINWKSPEDIRLLLGSLARYTQNVLDAHKADSNFNNTLRGWVNTSLQRASNLSYQHILANKVKKYSFDNPQIIESVFITLSNVLSKGQATDAQGDLGAAIMPLFKGNHYIVHPMKGLVNIVEVNRDGIIIPMLKSAMQKEDEIINERDELKWNDPIKETEQGFVRFSDALSQAENKAGRDALREELDQGLWSGGEAEILLPADMQNSFFMKDRAEELGRPIQVTDITPGYLEEKLTEKNEGSSKPKSPEEISGDAMLMFAAYKLRLSGLTARIPSTAKHSAVNTTIIGFMHESANAVFVPIELLAVQGADQDIDKGEHLTYETIGGTVPFTNDTFDDVLSGENYKNLIEQELGMPVELFENTDANFKKSPRMMKAALKNNVVKSLRSISSSPENTLEMNTTVEDALNELRGFASEAKLAMRLSMDDYASMATVRADNQAGKQLVSRFANALKAYQVLYGTVRSDANPPDSIDAFAGLYDSNNEIWIKFAALINAATDNGKEQILGALGINVDNANMVSYMIATGKSWDNIIDFFADESNAAELKKYYDARRYDSNKRTFNVSPWEKSNPELYQTFKKGEEFGLFAQSIINRELPSGSFKLFNFGNRIEDFVARNTSLSSFNFARFTDPTETGYRDNMIVRYEQAIQNNPDAMSTNILYALGKSTHISAYNAVYSFAQQTMKRESKVYDTTTNIASALTKRGKTKGFISEIKFKEVMNFVYGSVVHDFFVNNKVTEYDYDLSTPTGRTDFVKWFNQEWVPELKLKYRGNSFTTMFVPDEEFKYGRGKPITATRMRIQDVFQLDEEVALGVKADFDQLTKEDKGTLALYSLIVDKGRIRKGSFGAFFDPSESYISKFNGFLAGRVEINVGIGEYDLYDDNSIFKDNPGLYHNAIPYGNTDEVTTALEEKAAQQNRNSRVTDKGVVSNAIVDTLNAALPMQISIPYGANLKTEVSISTGGRPASRLLEELPDYYLDNSSLHQGEFEVDIMRNMKTVFDNINAPTNEESTKREENCNIDNTSATF